MWVDWEKLGPRSPDGGYGVQAFSPFSKLPTITIRTLYYLILLFDSVVPWVYFYWVVNTKYRFKYQMI
jgi:hypothetical protein